MGIQGRPRALRILPLVREGIAMKRMQELEALVREAQAVMDPECSVTPVDDGPNGWSAQARRVLGAEPRERLVSVKSKGGKVVSDYPELEKLSAISDKSQAIGEFLEWVLEKKGAFLALDVEWEEDKPTVAAYGLDPEDPDYETRKVKRQATCPLTCSVDDLLAEFFEIDQGKVDKERRAMLKAMREANKA